jgi:hypothetical protein
VPAGEERRSGRRQRQEAGCSLCSSWIIQPSFSNR